MALLQRLLCLWIRYAQHLAESWDFKLAQRMFVINKPIHSCHAENVGIELQLARRAVASIHRLSYPAATSCSLPGV